MNIDFIYELKNLKKKNATATLVLIISVIGFFASVNLIGPVGFVFAVPLIISAIIAYKSGKAFKTCYKENVVKEIVKEVFPDAEFNPALGISKETVYSTDMMLKGDLYSSNDLISGDYHGVKFMQSDVCIQDENTDSDGNTTVTTIFQGRWMIYEFNKNFRCDLQIRTKNFFASKKKGNIFTKKEERTHRIELEDEAFNKKFYVYAQDDHEAFYLLTPTVMGALTDLSNSLKAPFMLMFVGGVLHIAVNNHKDAFEPSVFGKLDLNAEKIKVQKDLKIITDFIDKLAMDHDIYK